MSKDEQTPTIPIAISILGAIGWLVFFLLHTFLWSPNYTFFQNIVISIFSLLGVGALIGLTWIAWFSRAVEKWFEGVFKEAGIEVTDANKKEIEEAIHKFIGECASEGRCSFNWADASKEIEADEQMRNELKDRLNMFLTSSRETV